MSATTSWRGASESRTPSDIIKMRASRTAGLGWLAKADALAAREMFLRFSALGALRAANSLVNALPPHIAGPGLGVAPDARWTGRGAPHALATACERRGAAIYRKAN